MLTTILALLMFMYQVLGPLLNDRLVHEKKCNLIFAPVLNSPVVFALCVQSIILALHVDSVSQHRHYQWLFYDRFNLKRAI